MSALPSSSEIFSSFEDIQQRLSCDEKYSSLRNYMEILDGKHNQLQRDLYEQQSRGGGGGDFEIKLNFDIDMEFNTNTLFFFKYKKESIGKLIGYHRQHLNAIERKYQINVEIPPKSSNREDVLKSIKISPKDLYVSATDLLTGARIVKDYIS